MASVAVVASLLAASPAVATDAKHKQEQVRRQRQEVQRQLDLAKASDAKVETEVARLDGAVRKQQTSVEDARRAKAFATIGVAAAERKLGEIESRARATRRRLVDTAVQTYMGRTAETASASGPTTGRSLDDITRGQAYLRIFRARGQDVLDELRQAKEDQAIAKRGLERAREEATNRAGAEEEQARLLATAKNSQTAAHDALQGRISDLQEESRRLAAQEGQIVALLRSSSRSAGPIGTVSNVGLIWPVRGPVTSEYGPRWGGFHPGIDIAPPAGTPIRAAKAGKVIYAGFNDGGYGNFVIIDHGGGIATAYAHMASIATSQGASIGQGQTVGTVGSTGYSTGPHLHFELRVNGSTQNPRSYESGSP